MFRRSFCPKIPGGTTWNQVTKQETVVGYPDLRKTDALGRVNVVHANSSECFNLRILLHVVKGPTSFIYFSRYDL